MPAYSTSPWTRFFPHRGNVCRMNSNIVQEGLKVFGRPLSFLRSKTAKFFSFQDIKIINDTRMLSDDTCFILVLCSFPLQQPLAMCPSGSFNRDLQEKSENISLWFGLSSINTGIPDGLVISWTAFRILSLNTHWAVAPLRMASRGYWCYKCLMD